MLETSTLSTNRTGFGQRIDFYLPDYDVAIECKRFHTPRSLRQLSAHKEIILIQGMQAAKAFRALLKNT
jgi:hypothetical protein